ncbi:SURF1 family protein [Cellulomonas sp. APG4]|uniref:SURF1 family protein n=1 Tax=Cellulomonas sp. APG4 TaxID=1538656 RepID=UPI00351BE483
MERRPDYLRTATSPRMLLVLALLLGAAAVCVRLGVWQLDRAEIRGDLDAERRAAEVLEAPAEPLAEVLRPGDPFAGEDVGRKVVTSGRFGDDAVLVPGRAHDGTTGYLVVSPLEVERAGASIAVVRGWAPDAEAAAAAAPAPDGVVEVTGYLAAGEAAGAVALPREAGLDVVEAVSPAQLVNRWGGRTHAGYLVLLAPAQPGLEPLDPPTLGEGGLNVQNLAYALQWWIFGGFAVLLWGRMVRDAARDEIEDDDGPDGEGLSPADGSRAAAAAP